jgi:hypothetical protein
MTIATFNVTTAVGNVYTSGGNTAITSLTLCNWGNSTVTANLYVVPSGQTANTSTQMLCNLSMTSNETAQLYTFAEKLLLANGDTVRVSATANTVTSITSYTAI